MKKKKKWALVLVLLFVAAGVAFFFAVRQQLPTTIATANGDDIILNEVSFTTVESDTSFDVLTEEEYANAFPGQGGLGSEFTLPEGVENSQHLYQVTKATEDADAQLHDEVYLWETEIYENPKEKVLEVSRNDGLREVTADRGYVELTLTKEDAPLSTDETLFSEEMNFANSTLNGKTVIVKKINGTSVANRDTYEATVRDAYGDGINAFLVADNVDEAYFVKLLEILTGTADSF
ncbi:MAG: hypothetical protein Q4C25_07235 [Bacillota bacterium]|nr:hypothetical protein [Bacillota bacterium]